MNFLIELSKSNPFLSCFICGLLTPAIFAPYFFTPSLVFIAWFAFILSKAPSIKEGFWIGYYYGFGYFLTGLYWISVGVSVYREEFWWAIPIAFIGLPLFFAQFFGLVGIISYIFSKRILYPNSFAAAWVFAEWLRTWVYTGFPWNSAGDSLS
ncbi:MAG: apolipoprotein N-acyltransferase, partial [Rickettsiaceae bacterium]|nr:apolipoprotein N-acyltransferase [Rickettsiaceae bacterium]